MQVMLYCYTLRLLLRFSTHKIIDLVYLGLARKWFEFGSELKFADAAIGGFVEEFGFYLSLFYVALNSDVLCVYF